MTAKDSAAMSALTEKLRAANEAAALRRDGEEKHTPLPWVVNVGRHAYITNPLYKGIVALMEHSPDRFLCVASPNDHMVTLEEDAANAAFIVRACNAHEELVAALRWLTEATGCADPDCCKAAIDHAAAIHRGRTILAALDGSKP